MEEKEEPRGFTEDEWRRIIAENHERFSGKPLSARCFDCYRPYADAGFPDFIIPFWAWKRISPSGDDGGLLCPSCICGRLERAGIKCEGAFMSGPIISVSEHAMNLHRRIENIELAIEGRNNRWAGIRELVESDSEQIAPQNAG